MRGVLKPRLRDEATRMEMWTEHRATARHLARNRALRSRALCEDDLYQVADIALWDATGLWDESLGSCFRSFAYRSIRGSVLAESLRNSIWGHKASRVSLKKSLVLPGAVGRLWLGQDGGDEEDEPLAPGEAPGDALAAREVAERLLDRLGPGPHQTIARLAFLEGLTNAEAGKRMGIEAEAARRLRTDSLRRLRLAARDLGLYDQ